MGHGPGVSLGFDVTPKLIHLHLRVPVHRRGRRRSQQIRGRLLHVITGTRHKTWIKIKDTLTPDSATLALLVNNINKIKSDVESLSNRLEGLGSYVESIEKGLKKYNREPDPEFRLDLKPSSLNPIDLLPSFPDKFDLNVFCNWVTRVETCFSYYFFSEAEKAQLVARTLPQEGEAFRWWQGIQNESMQVDERPFDWSEMKLLFLAEFVSPKCLEANKKSKTSF
ncbi:uncharacterized protein LOC111895514 isoform X2 [Lactuca sativa]|uniref:uncharacterized protein LOC111895514 isoform X2 n=1 Tax=Lactuca sativa TaxID=4236 RepID=UPI001C68BD12|nr:uncharacterized protein LOC111895514 isoform X2 [Lactuca sativa]